MYRKRSHIIDIVAALAIITLMLAVAGPNARALDDPVPAAWQARR